MTLLRSYSAASIIVFQSYRYREPLQSLVNTEVPRSKFISNRKPLCVTTRGNIEVQIITNKKHIYYKGSMRVGGRVSFQVTNACVLSHLVPMSFAPYLINRNGCKNSSQKAEFPFVRVGELISRFLGKSVIRGVK